MAKEELLQFDGSVTDLLPDGRLRVRLENGRDVIAYTSGKLKKHRIRMLAGDRVLVEMSPYDLEKGRVIFRQKDEQAVPSTRPQWRRR